MCGICGLLARPGTPPDTGLVERMSAAIVHRGPDSGSVHAVGSCALGVRRLAILDLETGDQPVANETGEITAVFNGELYNFRALRDRLSGHQIRGTGDTPVIPHLYEEHGLGFAEQLDGMFAIALWDAPRNRLVLARDRLGKKPLLWTRLPDGRIAFASELKALLEIPELERRVRVQALDDYLALQYVPGPETVLEGVQKVRPGHLLVVEDGEVREHRYWEPRVVEERLSREEWLERVRAEVTGAVRKRLASDVPLGALLSGGIDSSIVVALMAAASAEPVRTFTIGFEEERYDERAFARAVAERYSTVHEEVPVALDASLVTRAAAVLDEPLGDEAFLPQLLVSEAARRHVTVALAGDGGDEAFAGYERYAAVALAERVPAPLARAGAAALGLIPAAGREPRSPLYRSARFLRAAAEPRGARYAHLVEVFPYELRRRLFVDDVDVRPTAEILGAPGPGLAGLQRLDLETYLPGDLLVKADLASMAASLELRAPLLDHRVVELGLSLPEELKLRGRTGKLALREAFADLLPPQVAARGKTGFGVPLERWFREDLRELATDLLTTERGWFRPREVERLLRAHRDGRADHGHRLWCLLMLELWQRTYVDSERQDRSPTG